MESGISQAVKQGVKIYAIRNIGNSRTKLILVGYGVWYPVFPPQTKLW